VEGSCKHCNEPSGSIKCWRIPEWLRNWRLLKKDSAPWSYVVSRKVYHVHLVVALAPRISVNLTRVQNSVVLDTLNIYSLHSISFNFLCFFSSFLSFVLPSHP
jgi:hypothetical protein